MTGLRAGIIGSGFMGRTHTRSARLAGVEVTGVTASTPAGARDAAGRLGIPTAHDDADALIVADDVDVVHVCTPNHLHEPLARAALEAGKHVVCEKPLTTDGGEAVALAELAAAEGLVATVPFVYRFYATVREARHRVARGDTGPLRLIHGHYLQDWMSRPEDTSWRVDADLGGPSRAFADIGSHWCDLVEFVSGHRISELAASTAVLVPERAEHAGGETFAGRASGGRRVAVDTEDAATVMFRTDGGAVGTMLVSQVSPGRKNQLRFSLDGADAAVGFDQEHPDTLWEGRRSDTREIARDALTTEDARRLSPVPAGHPLGYQDCFDTFMADTYAAVAGDEPAGLPTFADGARAAVLTDAVLRSAGSGGDWVGVPAPGTEAATARPTSSRTHHGEEPT